MRKFAIKPIREPGRWGRAGGRLQLEIRKMVAATRKLGCCMDKVITLTITAQPDLVMPLTFSSNVIPEDVSCGPRNPLRGNLYVWSVICEK